MQVSKLVGGLRDGNNLVEYKSFMGKLFTRAQQQKQAAQQAQQLSARSQAVQPVHLGTHAPEPRRVNSNKAAGSSRHPAGGAALGGAAAGSAAGAAGGAAAEPELQLPNWAAARQRRLSTAVAQTLGQQPAATAAEAARVASPAWHQKSPRKFRFAWWLGGLLAVGQWVHKEEQRSCL